MQYSLLNRDDIKTQMMTNPLPESTLQLRPCQGQHPAMHAESQQIGAAVTSRLLPHSLCFRFLRLSLLRLWDWYLRCCHRDCSEPPPHPCLSNPCFDQASLMMLGRVTPDSHTAVESTRGCVATTTTITKTKIKMKSTLLASSLDHWHAPLRFAVSRLNLGSPAAAQHLRGG